MNLNATPTTQNELLLNNLLRYYKDSNNMERMLSIINGESETSLRVIDWFVTNYSKTHYTIYCLSNRRRFKVYSDYKLKLKSYSKRRFDPFCRWDRIMIPYENDTNIQTTIGQLNFFKWAFENEIIEYIEKYKDDIESDMNARNGTAKRKQAGVETNKTRKKREELSVSASKVIRKDEVEVTVSFG